MFHFLSIFLFLSSSSSSSFISPPIFLSGTTQGLVGVSQVYVIETFSESLVELSSDSLGPGLCLDENSLWLFQPCYWLFTYLFLHYSILVRYIFTFIILESMFSFNNFILDVLVYYHTYDRYVYV